MEIQEILSYLKIIRKWWWVIILLFVATVGTMLTSAFIAETEYRATVTVQVSAPPPQEVPLYSQFGRQALRDEIEQTRSSFSEFLLEGDVAYRTLETLPDMQIKGGELRDRMTIDNPSSSQLMHVRVRALEPQTAALLANEVVTMGLQRYGMLQAQSTANTIQFIEREMEVAREELKAAEASLTQFQIDNKIGTLETAIDTQYGFVNNMTSQRDLARINGDITTVQIIGEIIVEREVELQNLIGLSAEYDELIDNVDRARSTYNFLLDAKAEAQIKENQILEMGSIQIITPARPPNRPLATLNKL